MIATTRELLQLLPMTPGCVRTRQGWGCQAADRGATVAQALLHTHLASSLPFASPFAHYSFRLEVRELATCKRQKAAGEPGFARDGTVFFCCRLSCIYWLCRDFLFCHM